MGTEGERLTGVVAIAARLPMDVDTCRTVLCTEPVPDSDDEPIEPIEEQQPEANDDYEKPKGPEKHPLEMVTEPRECNE